MKAILLAVICVIFGYKCFSQNDTIPKFSSDFNFIIHLANNELFEEAEIEKEKLFEKVELSQLYKDSVNYFMGMAYFKNKQFDLAKKCFRKISDVPFFYYKSVYMATMIEAEQNNLDTALFIINQIEESTSNDLNELKQFELACILLLKRKHLLFDSINSQVNFKNQFLRTEYSNLTTYYAVDKKIKRKSPLLAGVFSTIIPGLGKVYSGNNGQGLASFLSCGLFGAVAAENTIRLGYKHPQSLVFMGLFGAFYIGNIWGSVLSVQTVKNEKQQENKFNILVSLKLPISKFFN